ncbi:hypothetical protein B0I35DRAFT_350971 [Stachybotrys elegans]|uniref:FAD-binding domain-containing protein n=1 Tax=Stachybotrys elegans TaxID=80388 RepID=A0A8K0SYP6_9HYPO|nr:hypothetical protein B0I35DRAFT_350971 [Stachybotrys elegans]
MDAFKVIIVGGGPVGLTAAHALYKAGIKFELVERRNGFIVDEGAGLAIGPQNLRVFHQLGVLDKLLEHGTEILQNKGFTSDGRQFKGSWIFKTVSENHGSGPVAIHRTHVMKTLYNSLPHDICHCHINKNVVNIHHTEHGVEVICSDGTTIKGDMVLGADGANSRVRKIMRKLALAEDPHADWDSEEVYLCEYRSVWFSLPRTEGVAEGQLCETQDTNHSITYIQGRDRGWVFLYEKLPQPTTERVTYTEKDMIALAEKLAEYPVNEKFKVKDAFAQRVAAGMGNLQEGVAKKWSWGRIALVGDACHKFTPNAGLGFNNGVQDVVAICNGLRDMIRETPRPDTRTLTRVFHAYQANRQELMQADAMTSGNLTRMQAWHGLLFYFMARFIMAINPLQVWLLNTFSTPLVQRSLILDYVAGEEPMRGNYPWQNKMPVN